MGKKKFLLIVLFTLVFALPSLCQIESIFIPAFEFQYPEADNEVEFEAHRYLSLLQCPSYKPRSFYAQVRLPDGAQIISMVIFYKDNYFYANMHVNMARWNMYTEDTEAMASFSSSGYNTSYSWEKISDIRYDRVKNGGYIYRIKVDFERATSELVLYGVKINYK